MSDIAVQAYNDVHVKIYCSRSIAMEMSEYFSFLIPGAQFNPLVKEKMWDGRIRLFNMHTQLLYKGLAHKIEKFATDRDYKLDIDSDIFACAEVSLNEIREYPFSKKMTPYDDQLEAIVHALRYKRAFILSPTASGKSFIAYCIIKYLIEQGGCKKVLYIVDSTNLCQQINTDWEEYSGGTDFYPVHVIMKGAAKDTTKPILVATWQSIYKMPAKWFDQFDLVIGDEAHTFKATSLTCIMEKLTACKYRFGITGTIDEESALVHSLVIQGLFGPKVQFVTTKELIDLGRLSPLKIKSVLLIHSDEDKNLMKKADYATEIDFLVKHEGRNKFITNLALSQSGNTLVLFRFVSHGKNLYEMIKKRCTTDRKIFLVYGKVDSDIREEIRKIVQECSDAIIVASVGTFSKGVNIPNLNNVIMASPYKSKIVILQSIGRSLRVFAGKLGAILIDIGDDLSYISARSKSGTPKKNKTLEHFQSRLRLYLREGFEFKLYQVQLRGKSNVRNDQ